MPTQNPAETSADAKYLTRMFDGYDPSISRRR
jgi:hypothetical protein